MKLTSDYAAWNDITIFWSHQLCGQFCKNILKNTSDFCNCNHLAISFEYSYFFGAQQSLFGNLIKWIQLIYIRCVYVYVYKYYKNININIKDNKKKECIVEKMCKRFTVKANICLILKKYAG